MADVRLTAYTHLVDTSITSEVLLVILHIF